MTWDILQEGQLAKVVTFFVGMDCLFLASLVFLSGCELSLDDDIEFVSSLSLMDDLIVDGDVQVLEHVSNLILLIRVSLFQNIDFR